MNGQESRNFPLLLTVKEHNVPKNYVVLTKLKRTGEVIAVSDYALELIDSESSQNMAA